MLISDFIGILKTFADKPEDLDITRGNLLFQVRDDVLEANVYSRGGELYVKENDVERPATRWLLERVARLPILADRILSYVTEPESFVAPQARLLDQTDYAPTMDDTLVENAAESALSVLARRPAGTASVMYLTSDAGEGKTTLINHLARRQASAFKKGTSDWLLVPIPLGGRSFLRFDDVVVAALANKLRFQWWYYDAFIELVRLGVVVPAFDGFEEMFVENVAGEALSALGSLMRTLQSSGSTLIAARKAYFEYQSFRTQARLFDGISSESVAFSRLALRRWTKATFLSYANKRSVANPGSIYELVASRLGEEHPLLTRAVLVRRLLDVAKEQPDLTAFGEVLGAAPDDYFFQFVNAMISREANEKWLTKSGETNVPLISLDEHHLLLSMIAQEMWISGVDSLKPELMDVISDLFCDSAKKDPVISRQVKERLKQHSLLTTSEQVRGSFSFDHEDFRKFFLGESLARLLKDDPRNDLHLFLQASALPRETCEHAVAGFRRLAGSRNAALRTLQQLSSAESPTSFLRENAGGLSIRLLEHSHSFSEGTQAGSGIEEIKDMNFPPDALLGRRVRAIAFRNCYFQPTSLRLTSLIGCRFENCRFERLEIEDGLDVSESTLSNVEVGSIFLRTKDEQIFDPEAIFVWLESNGFSNETRSVRDEATTHGVTDVRTKLLERVLRIFLRSTQVNENVITVRLGQKSGDFYSNVLPQLLRARVLEPIPYVGQGNQKRYKLAVPMREIQDALSRSNGDFLKFLQHFES